MPEYPAYGTVVDLNALHRTGNEVVGGIKAFQLPPTVPLGSFSEDRVAQLVADLAVRASKPVVGDGICFVSAAGNDANDGLSWGTAKATLPAALAALPASGGRVECGGGVFATAGDAITTGALSYVEVVGNRATVIRATSPGAIITLGDGVLNPRETHLVLRDLILDGNGVATSGVKTNGVKDFTLDGLKIIGVNGHAVELSRFTPGSGDFAGRLYGCRLVNCAGSGVYGHGGNDGMLYSGCFFENCGGWGIALDQDGVVASGGNVIAGCMFNNNTLGCIEGAYNTYSLFIVGGYGELGTAAASEFANPTNEAATARVLKLGRLGGKTGPIVMMGFRSSTQGGVATYSIELLNGCWFFNFAGNNLAATATGVLTGGVDAGMWAGALMAGTLLNLPNPTTNWYIFNPDGLRAPSIVVEAETLVAAFTNSWAEVAGIGEAHVWYSKDPMGVVRVHGAVGGGVTGQAAFTLPAGYRPSTTRRFAAIQNGNTTCVVVVNSDGTVVPTNVTSNTFVALDGIHFRAAT